MDNKNIEDIYPLTPAQEGILWHCLIEPEAGLYWNQNSFRVKGTLKVDLFKRAWETVVSRHASLRTIYNWSNPKKPLQVVLKSIELPWQVLDWTHLNNIEQNVDFEGLLQRDRNVGYNLQKSPLMRFYLIQESENRYRFLWANHHIMLDGWSVPIVLSDLWDVYSNQSRGINHNWNPVPGFNEHYDWLSKQDHDAARNFFKSYLEGFEEPTPIPLETQKLDSGKRGGQYDERSLNISSETLEALSIHTRRERLTLNSLFQGIWGILLSSYSNRNDIVFGSVFSGRSAPIPHIEKTVGLFINVLPIRLKIDYESDFQKWISDIQLLQADLQDYQFTPLRAIQHVTDIPTNQSLFDSLFVFENYPNDLVSKKLPDDLSVHDIRSDERDNFPLTFLVELHEKLKLTICFDPHRYSSQMIEQMLAHADSIISRLSKDLSGTVDQLGELPDKQKQELLLLAGSTSFQMPPHQTLCHLVSESSRENGASPAICLGNETLNYDELEKLVVSLASRLVHSLKCRNQPVGICFERSPGLIVACLAAMRTGGAYVPIDPDWPSDRIGWVLRDSAPGVIIAGKRKEAHIIRDVISINPDLAGIQLVEYGAQTFDQKVEADSINGTLAEPDSLAYIIYTSGSTGNPKGVLVDHRNAVSSTLARSRFYGETPLRFLLLSPSVFDSSVAGIFWTLSNGGCLVLPPVGVEKDPEALANIIIKEKVTHFLCLPSVHALLLPHLAGKAHHLSTIIVAGESCPWRLPEKHRQVLPGVKLFNEYGPTEATVWCSVDDITDHPNDELVSIGKPIPNTGIHLVNSRNDLVPRGAVGEIAVSGPGVARGYLNRPEMDADRFQHLNGKLTENPRIYKTGDLARWNQQGKLQFLGRVDNQVKIRGYRIELGEIEKNLLDYGGVQECAVVLRRRNLCDADQSVHSYLAAFVKSGTRLNGTTTAQFRDFLLNRLPSYMIPSSFVILEDFPRTSTGKLDRKALLDWELEIEIPKPSLQFDFEAGTPIHSLHQIWCSLLGRNSIGPNDNFFELGGDSILAINMISRAKQAGIHTSVKELFQNPTLSSLVPSFRDEAVGTTEFLEEEGPFPLTPILCWFRDLRLPNPHHWNQSVLYEIPAQITVDHIRQAMEYLHRIHSTLRLSLEVESDWKASIKPFDKITVSVESMEVDSDEVSLTDYIKKVADKVHGSMELNRPSLLKTVHFSIPGDACSRLLLVAHHLLTDAVSWHILWQDLNTLFSQILDQMPLNLVPSSTPFRHWSHALEKLAQSRALNKDLEFWCNQRYPENELFPLEGAEEALEVESEIVIHRSVIPENEFLKVKELVDSTRLGIQGVLTTAFVVALVKWTNKSTQLLWLEGHGREDLIPGLDLSRTAGWFTSFFPVVFETSLAASALEMEKEVIATMQDIPNRGMSFGLLRYLTKNHQGLKVLKKLESPKIVFNYLGRVNANKGSADAVRSIQVDVGVDRDPMNSQKTLLETNAHVSNDQLNINWKYNKQKLSEATIVKVATYFHAFLVDWVSEKVPSTVASPFSESGLDEGDLQSLFE